MMDCIRYPAPVHQEDRVAAPFEPRPERLRDAYFAAVPRLTLGVVRAEPWRLRLGPLTVLEFGEPVARDGGWTWPITGGVAARRPGGSLSYRWRDGELTGVVDGYEPRLPAPLYRLLQVPVHHVLTRQFLLLLRGRTPGPGVPAGPAQRLVTASLDLGLCAALTAVLRPRRRLATFAGVASLYHLALWTVGGRTAAGLLTGQRIVSVDGSPLTLAQSAIRLAALPFALRSGRAVHDEAAGTEVVEA
jgi:hypothetical protein